MKINQVKQFVASNISRFEKTRTMTGHSFNLYDKNNLFRGEFNFIPIDRSSYMGIKNSLSSTRIVDKNRKLQMQEFIHMNKDYVTIKNKSTDTLTKALPNKITTIRTVIDYVKNKFITIQTTSKLKNNLQRIGENDPDFMYSDKLVIYEPLNEKPMYEKTVKVLREGKVSEMYGEDYETKDGTCVRDYINIEDLVDAHLLALDYLNNGGKTDFFNLGTNNGNSVKEVFEICEKTTNKNIAINKMPKREGDPACLVADNKKAKSILGWTPKNCLELSIKTAYEWEMNL